MNPNGVTPADGDAKEYHLDPLTLKKINEDLHNLIFRHSKVYDLTDSKQELYLAGEPSPIQFNKTDATDAERFIGLVEKYRVYLKELIIHLDYNSETEFVESKSIVGNIDIEKTRVYRANQSSKDTVVCTVYKKNLYTPENLLLGALLLAIHDLAKGFHVKIQETKDLDQRQKLQFLRQLESVANFSNFLLNDRFVNRICKYYLKNFESPQQIFGLVENRLLAGKIPLRYRNLLLFLQIWQIYHYVQLEKQNSFTKISGKYLNLKSEPDLYEYLVFYKILETFSDSSDILKQQSDHNLYQNSVYSIKFQDSKQIGWIRNGITMNRRRDIVIRNKRNKILAVVDAKFFPPRIDTEIENQMLIYLDYGDDKSDLVIVLFCFPGDELVYNNNDRTKEMIFKSCHPSSSDKVLQWMKEKINSI